MGYMVPAEAEEAWELDAKVLGVRSQAVLLDRTPFHPRSLEQPSDRGWLCWKGELLRVRRVEHEGGRKMWHLLHRAWVPPGNKVQAIVDRSFRDVMRQLHTDLHILSALVVREFPGSLVLAVQMNPNGTAHVDFEIPEVDNLKLRSLQGELNTTIARGLEVRACFVPKGAERDEPGLLRGRGVTPRRLPDGRMRVVEIAGLDRQACDGRHLDNTAQSPPLRIVKIRNLNRHTRRVYVGLEDAHARRALPAATAGRKRPGA